MTPIQYLEREGITTHSVAKAIQELSAKQYDGNYYQNVLNQITGDDYDFLDDREARFTFLYFFQMYLRYYNNLDSAFITTACHESAKQFIDKYPWMWAKDNSTDKTTDTLTDALDLYKRKKHKLNRMQINALFREHFGMSEDEAAVLATKCISKCGPCKEDTTTLGEPATPKINKKQVALEVYSSNMHLNKEQIIAILATSLNTTQAGAQTYYYTCKRELGSCAGAEQPQHTTMTKLDRAREILLANGHLTKPHLLELFINELDTTPAGANTYYNKLNKENNK